MIGIYKITNPNGKIYIGQSINIESRKHSYSKLRDCKNQTKLYNSLVKYGFSAHIFECIEQCTIEQLNERERYWQDYYNVLKEGLNCKLTGSRDRSGKLSEEAIRKRVANTDWSKKVLNTDFQKRTANTDYAKRTANTDLITKAANTDYAKKVRNTDYKTIANKNKKAVQQYTKQGILIREWQSGREAGQTLGISSGSISSCCRKILKSAGGFIWKYK